MLLFKQIEIPDFDLGVDFVDTLKAVSVRKPLDFFILFFPGIGFWYVCQFQKVVNAGIKEKSKLFQGV